MIETITDCEVGLATAIAPPLAWYDPNNGEIGDICNAKQGTIVGADSVTYTVQTEWSNLSKACIVSKPSTFFVLYNQDNNFAGSGQVSQNFTDAGGINDSLDSQAADDFVVPNGQKWTVSSVGAQGFYFNGPGPATNVTVFIYANASGAPGALEFSSTQVPTSGLATGSFVIGLVDSPGTWTWYPLAVDPDEPATQSRRENGVGPNGWGKITAS